MTHILKYDIFDIRTTTTTYLNKRIYDDDDSVSLIVY